MPRRGFVHTFKRDYVNVHELRDAESVLAQLAARIDDYDLLAPHSALGMRSPADYRAVTSARRELDHTSVRMAGGDLADVGLRNPQASEVRSGSPGTVIARITRCVSAPRSVA
jgi:hypothetical protein